MGEFKPIETQEAFDAAIKERLERQSTKLNADITALRGELESLKMENGNLISERDAIRLENENHKGTIEKFNGFEEKLAALTAENSSLRNAAVRREVADRFGLPKEMAERLVGTDEASLTEDAEKLSLFLNAHSSGRMPRPSSDVPAPDESKNAFKEMLSKLN